MKCNMGVFDRIVRIAIAIIFVLLVVFAGIDAMWLKVVLIAFAAIFVLTSLFAFCPLYMPLKITTKCKTKTETTKD